MGAAEWTVESNPETLNEGFLETCEHAGVTRLSVGIQSFSTKHLRTLRRRATREHALSAIQLLRERWGGRLNLDFITGIPGQTVSDVEEDLAVLGDGWPDHVSLYQLTVEPGTPLEAMVNQGGIALNTTELDETLWLMGREELIRRGYGQYEVSNFCLPGHECRHNMRYWRIDPYVGAGPGAVSTLPAEWAARTSRRPELARREQSVVRFTVPRNLSEFLEGDENFWGIETEMIGPTDFLLETVMMGLRLRGGIPEAAVRSRFGGGFAQLLPGVWEGWVGRGLALPPDGSLRLSPDGLLLLDMLLREVVDAMRRTSFANLRLEWP
jgi:oxygen-independent coproporphyrinogen-3 oxidase